MTEVPNTDPMPWNAAEDKALAPIIEDAKEENAAIAAKEAGEVWHVCGRCNKRFESTAALRMHKMRVHTPAGRQGAKKGGQKAAKNRWQMNIPKGSTREKELERRRIYQKKLRDRYYAEGRDSKGNLRPAGWKPQPRVRGLKPSYVSTLTGKAQEDYRAKQRAYQRNHYAKMQARKKAADSKPSTGTISSDITGEAARAILLAAKVIRGVAQSLKLP